MRKQAIPVDELPGKPALECGWSWTAFFFTLFAFMGNKVFFMILGFVFLLKLIFSLNQRVNFGNK